jgi:hypothetical protein
MRNVRRAIVNVGAVSLVLKVLEVAAACAHGQFGWTIPHNVSEPACHESLGKNRNVFSYVYTSSTSSLARGIQSEGNPTRMQRFQAKVAEGQSITIGVAGASFSTGYHADWEGKKGCAHLLTYSCVEQRRDHS